MAVLCVCVCVCVFVSVCVCMCVSVSVVSVSVLVITWKGMLFTLLACKRPSHNKHLNAT